MILIQFLLSGAVPSPSPCAEDGAQCLAYAQELDAAAQRLVDQGVEGAIQRRAQALFFLHRACDLGEEAACGRITELLSTQELPACEMGWAPACADEEISVRARVCLERGPEHPACFGDREVLAQVQHPMGVTSWGVQGEYGVWTGGELERWVPGGYPLGVVGDAMYWGVVEGEDTRIWRLDPKGLSDLGLLRDYRALRDFRLAEDAQGVMLLAESWVPSAGGHSREGIRVARPGEREQLVEGVWVAANGKTWVWGTDSRELSYGGPRMKARGSLEAHGWYTSVSPGGTHIAFHRDGQAWVLEVASGKEWALVAGEPGPWSADGQWVAVYGNDVTRILDLSGQVLLELPDTSRISMGYGVVATDAGVFRIQKGDFAPKSPPRAELPGVYHGPSLPTERELGLERVVACDGSPLQGWIAREELFAPVVNGQVGQVRERGSSLVAGYGIDHILRVYGPVGAEPLTVESSVDGRSKQVHCVPAVRDSDREDPRVQKAMQHLGSGWSSLGSARERAYLPWDDLTAPMQPAVETDYGPIPTQHDGQWWATRAHVEKGQATFTHEPLESQRVLVVDPQSAPMPGALLSIRLEKGPWVWVSTDLDGWISIPEGAVLDSPTGEPRLVDGTLQVPAPPLGI